MRYKAEYFANSKDLIIDKSFEKQKEKKKFLKKLDQKNIEIL
jgi:hypothetical protein